MFRPEIIYKYEPCTLQSLRNLKAQAIYFGAPANFNDPYDCALNPNVRLPSDKDLSELRSVFLKADDVPEAVKEELVRVSSDQLGELLTGCTRLILEKHANQFLKSRGVTCFSEANNNLLMWSHYADRYRGFCLGFRTEFGPFPKIRKVQYSDFMPEIDVVAALIHNDFDQMLDLFFSKSTSWAYEKEWRCVHDTAGTVFTYPPEALDSIYFGPEIDIETLEIICLIMLGQNPAVNLWRGRRDDREFKVHFDKFEYAPHVSIKHSS